MIISKTPFRVSLFGGSTDYESHYKNNGATLIGFAMDQYCHLAVRKTPKIFGNTTKIIYSKTEIVEDNSTIQHNGVRGVLQYLDIKYGIEISHMSDLPAQTGIGSSSSFIVGLLNACYTLDGIKKTPHELASEAIYIERILLGEAGGIQDQIFASFAGLNSIHISKSGDFEVRPIPVGEKFLKEFLRRSILVYTGNTRESYEVAQSHCGKEKDGIGEIVNAAMKAFYTQDLDTVGVLLDRTWQAKKRISSLISNEAVDKIYAELRSAGMIGGKLLGAGGSGFIFGILKDGCEFSHPNQIPVGLAKHGSIIL